MMPIESEQPCNAPARVDGQPEEAIQERARPPVYDRRIHARLLVAAGHSVAAVAALFGEDPEILLSVTSAAASAISAAGSSAAGNSGAAKSTVP